MFAGCLFVMNVINNNNKRVMTFVDCLTHKLASLRRKSHATAPNQAVELDAARRDSAHSRRLAFGANRQILHQSLRLFVCLCVCCVLCAVSVSVSVCLSAARNEPREDAIIGRGRQPPRRLSLRKPSHDMEMKSSLLRENFITAATDRRQTAGRTHGRPARDRWRKNGDFRRVCLAQLGFVAALWHPERRQIERAANR